MTDAEKITALSQALEACLDCMIDGASELDEKQQWAYDMADAALAATVDTDRSASDYTA